MFFKLCGHKLNATIFTYKFSKPMQINPENLQFCMLELLHAYINIVMNTIFQNTYEMFEK